MGFEIREMADREYFADPALDQSALKRFMVSPLSYVDYLDHGLDVSGDALDFGKAAHALVLGTGAEVVDRPNLRTKAGKALMEELRASDAVVVSSGDRERLRKMGAVSAPYFRSLSGRPEMVVVADDPGSGLRLKGKFDWLPDGPDEDGVLRIRDYKTTSADPREFPGEAARFGYHIQAAFYMMLYRLTGFQGLLGFEFVVQEKKRPYDYMVWRMDEDGPEAVLAGERIAQALDELAGFRRDSPDDWKRRMGEYGLDKTPRTVGFPGWRIDREYEEMEV